jgi:hypothetical protein
VCVDTTLKPTPWLTSYHGVARACAENSWFRVNSFTLFSWVAIAVVSIPLMVWEMRKRRKQ